MEIATSPMAQGMRWWNGGLCSAIVGITTTLIFAPAALAQSSALVSVGPSAVSLGPSQTQQFQAASIRANTSVSWSLTPAVGSISKDGLYTAPPSVTSQSTVTVTATTVYPPIAAGTAVITLTPVAPLGLSPARASVWASQGVQFTVTGGNNGGVNWSMNPVVGTLSNGLYTAPSLINAAQSVTITATSSANPAQKAYSVLQLWPVSVSVAPTSVRLSGGGSLQFQASVIGNWNGGVTWSVSPPVGSVTNGLYTAPMTITTLQTIILTAVGVADPTKAAQAAITLMPPKIVGLNLTPSAAALMPGQGQQFTAVDQNGQSTPVSWSINPPVGSINSNGLYSGPVTVSQPQTVTVTATSTTDTSQSASVALSLAGNIQLPIEVMGASGTTTSVGFCIPQGTNLSGQLLLSMRIHGLHYETQASLQLNNSAWLPINTSTVALQGSASAYGGIGGGFSTLQMTMNLPAGALATGLNTLTFRFNQTDGRRSGFRVLAFNILAPDGSQLLPAGSFVYDDPNTWQPPLNTPTDIAAGKTAWYQAALTAPTPTGPVTIQANCTSCHAQDGRDLKYFNYSNNAIRARAVFHGLTAQQGDQIASYIRTLTVANPGRPWNPPYQPGPGLDSQPVINWAAGAGIDAVLNDYGQMLNGMFPAGIQDSMFSATANLNIRETAVPLQMPDWNSWLPGTHPMDAFGSAFTSNGYYTIYQTIRSNLKVLDPNAYANQVPNFDNWANANYGMYITQGTPIVEQSSSLDPTDGGRDVLAAAVGDGEDLGDDERVPTGGIRAASVWFAVHPWSPTNSVTGRSACLV